jgi:hypothetical protein
MMNSKIDATTDDMSRFPPSLPLYQHPGKRRGKGLFHTLCTCELCRHCASGVTPEASNLLLASGEMNVWVAIDFATSLVLTIEILINLIASLPLASLASAAATSRATCSTALTFWWLSATGLSSLGGWPW